MTENEAPSELEIANPPESQFCINWHMTDPDGISCQFTLRSTFLDDHLAVLATRKTLVEKAKANGWKVPAQAPTASAAAGNGAPKPPAGTPTLKTVQSVTSQVQSIVVTRIESTPKPEGKVELKLFAAGHKFPDLYLNRSLKDLVAQIAPTGAWDDSHFAAAEEYEVSWAVDYTLSPKLNSKGNPYKDVIAIRPA